MSSVGHAQELNTPRASGDRALTIDDFPPPSASDLQRARARGKAESIELPAPLEDTFTLHSNPGASKVIYLDFDGHWIIWLGQDYYYVPWDMDGVESTFSDDERTVIQLAWQSIAEDFLPFDLDVTTEDPGVEALMNTGGDDVEWGIRAVINHTSDSYSWAYNDSFSDSEDTELFAWTGNFDSLDETWIWIADSVSHEAGHALGLSHDGTTTGIGYYEGHGTGDIAWSPIMGWTNYGLSQWSIGEYTDANNQQDDLSIITAQNGFGFRADDHGSTADTATPLDLSVGATGIIEQREDLDFFSLTLERPGTVTVTISPDGLAPNLDIEAVLYDASGAVLQTANPEVELHAALEVSLTAGEYHLSVDGVGYDDPKSDGYSDYASLGYYRLAVQLVEDEAKDTAAPADTGADDDTAEPSDTGEGLDSGASEGSGDAAAPAETDERGCGCSAGGLSGSGVLVLVFSVLVWRRQP